MSETKLRTNTIGRSSKCDVFVSLFFTKTGKYTEEEFATAHKDHFMNTGRPFIYTYFKNASITTGEAREEDLNSLWKFKRRSRNLATFLRTTTTSSLHGKFGEQIEEMLKIEGCKPRSAIADGTALLETHKFERALRNFGRVGPRGQDPKS